MLYMINNEQIETQDQVIHSITISQATVAQSPHQFVTRKRTQFINQRQPSGQQTQGDININVTSPKSVLTANSPNNSIQFLRPHSDDMIDILDEQNQQIDAFSKFNLNVFLESLFYHLLQNYLFGPFTHLIMQLLNPKTSLYRNMRMQPRLDKLTLLQNSMWLANLSTLFIYFLVEDTSQLRSEILFSQIFQILRCIIIASRYCNFGVEKMILYRTVDLSVSQLTRDFYFGEWKQQTPRIIYIDISSTIQRNQIDKQLFYFQFLVDPQIKTAERLVQHNLDISEFHKFKTEFEPQSIVFEDDTIHFYGYSIVSEFIEIFNRRIRKFSVRIQYFATLFCIVNILIPIIQRYKNDRLNWDLYTAILIPEAFLIFMNGRFVVTYNLIGVVDLLRKIFLLGQCANLVSAQKKLEFSDVKTLPTINIFCWANLKAWNILRRICFEYGQFYFLRAQILFTVQIAIIFVVAIVFILHFLKVIILDGTFIELFFLSFICTFIVTLVVLYCAAKINGYFDIYQNLLRENKLVISQLYKLRDLYSKKGLAPRNYLQSRGIALINFSANKCHTTFSQSIKELKKAYNEALESLNVQAQNPFTIMSIEINSGVFSSYVITIGSIFLTIIGQLFFNLIK